MSISPSPSSPAFVEYQSSWLSTERTCGRAAVLERQSYLTGRVRSPLRRSISLWGTGYQRKLSFQLKPPYVMSEPAMYSNVSSLMTSMMGHTTAFLQTARENHEKEQLYARTHKHADKHPASSHSKSLPEKKCFVLQ